MGGSSTTTSNQNSSQSNYINPDQMAQYQANYQTAQNNANSLQPYTGQMVAGFTQPETQAMGILSNVATDPQYAANNNSAINSLEGVLSSNPNTTITPQTVNAPTINPATIAGTDLTPYLNPFQKDVVNSTMAQLNQQQGQALAADQANASGEGAFGGSRSGVEQALTQQLYNQDEAQTLAGLNSANFTNAENMAGQDAATRNAIAAMNAGNAINTGEFNTNASMTGQQSTVADTLAKQQQEAAAAGQLVGLNGTVLNQAEQQAGILGNVGSMQQTQKQNELSAAYQAYLQGNQLTLQQQQLLNSALGMIPIQQTVNGNENGTSTTTTNPGIGGILGGIGSLGLGIAGMSMGIPGLGSAAGGLLGLGGGSAGQSSGPAFGWT